MKNTIIERWEFDHVRFNTPELMMIIEAQHMVEKMIDEGRPSSEITKAKERVEKVADEYRNR